MIINKHLPGLVIGLLIIGIGIYYEHYMDTGLVEEIPNSNLAVVKGYDFKDSRMSIKNQKALNYYKQQDFENCVRTYEEMLIDDPEEAGSYAGLGACQMWLNDFDGAEYNYQMALKYAPDSAIALNGLGRAAVWRKDYATSLEFYKKSLKSKPSFAVTHSSIAYVYAETQQYELAEKHHRKVVKLVPGTALAARSKNKLEVIKKLKAEQKNFN